MNRFIEFLKYWFIPVKKEIPPLSFWDQFFLRTKAIDLDIPRRSHSFDLSNQTVMVMFKNMSEYQTALRGASRAITEHSQLYEEQYNSRPFSVELDTFFITEKRIYIESSELFQSFLNDGMTFLKQYQQMESDTHAEDFRLIRILKPLFLNVQLLFTYFHELSQ